MFFDGSKSRDATALIGCRISDGHVFTLGIWEPNLSLDPDAVVPVEEVDRCVADAFATYEVAAFFADVQEWQSFALVSWPKDYGAGLRVKAVPTGTHPQPIAFDMRVKVRDFALAAELCQAEITAGLFTHDGDARLARHVANVRNRISQRSGMGMLALMGKETKDSPHKIDAAVAMVGARMARLRVIEADAQPAKKPHDGTVVFQ
jgi:hypothetical protein